MSRLGERVSSFRLAELEAGWKGLIYPHTNELCNDRKSYFLILLSLQPDGVNL